VEDALAAGTEALLASFPAPDWDGWHRYPDDYQREKLICSDFALIPEPLQHLITELNGPAVLRLLERVSGIEGLVPDPYLEGGGLHCSGPGGVLAPHTDFHLYRRLRLYRRLNLLLYLNEGWEQDWGGCLELYSPSSAGPDRVIVPRWGTCVVFRTDDRSPHGFSRPIVGDHWRRSVALYYYTSVEAESYSGDTNTYWRQESQRSLVRRLRQRLYQGLILGSRGLGFVAHRVDPQLTRWPGGAAARRRQRSGGPGRAA
jgi:hypothetical protein